MYAEHLTQFCLHLSGENAVVLRIIAAIPRAELRAQATSDIHTTMSSEPSAAITRWFTAFSQPDELWTSLYAGYAKSISPHRRTRRRY